MELKVKRHNKIEHFNNFSLLLKYDSVGSAFSFSFYFDPQKTSHQELFQVGHYHQCDITHNGELLIRGFMLNNGFTDSPTKNLATVSGYSLPGVLEDSNIPVDLYPLQSDGKSLREIADHLTSLFPFGVVVDSSVSSKMNKVYDVTTAEEEQTIKTYLSSLAAQRSIIMSHTPEGNLLFTQAKTKQKPIYNFTQSQPGTRMSLSFNGQSMHSHITVQKQASITGGNSGKSTVRNPFVPYVYRPLVRTQSSGDDIDTDEAAKNVLASELKNIKLVIETNVWEINGKVITPNNIITVQNNELFLFNKSNWFIESVQLNGDEKQNTAILTCVPPEAYNGETPKYIFELPKEESHA